MKLKLTNSYVSQERQNFRWPQQLQTARGGGELPQAYPKEPVQLSLGISQPCALTQRIISTTTSHIST